MNTELFTNTNMTKPLNDWYQAMLSLQTVKATSLKHDIDEMINKVKNGNEEFQDQNLLLYYALLDFRYKMLADWLNIKDDSFDNIEFFDTPVDNYLAYYYHFFKGVHCTSTSNYNAAKEHLEKAEQLLKYIPDPLERAEFNYRMGNFYYQIYQQIISIEYIRKAKEEFSKHPGYEIHIALCENTFGLCCVDLKNYELAEESFNTAINIFQKVNNEEYILMVRHNLGSLYANQNLSQLAIRHASEVTKKNPKLFKALFVEAREYYKLGEYQLADALIEKGLSICVELNKKEFQYRFTILRELNNKVPTLTLEKVILEGISYFEEEKLWDCIQEYTEILAIRFYKEDNHLKASQYFYMSNNAKKNELEKGALK
ncbi:tetratricopeptide repeat protein [Bacillus gaemokensis]|uniref:Histidine kinase n=1 Tax=Bacillus gaemokensis TaxID=574375 RepID=A0A073KRE1_9BACI|nr:tetratricopeptide repeat protein [Bacillus gaemokensis]KEK24938.1 histidine kinase [Bacillus gaemokensis]KYG30247.1 histidine kinase [Bacillus gaemokensis]